MRLSFFYTIIAFSSSHHPPHLSTDTIGLPPEKLSLMCNHRCENSIYFSPLGKSNIHNISLKATLRISHFACITNCLLTVSIVKVLLLIVYNLPFVEYESSGYCSFTQTTTSVSFIAQSRPFFVPIT